MALRFRRTVTLVPGLRLNLGKRGVSLSAGVRGANVTLGRQGVYGNVGAPGTGLSYREKISDLPKQNRSRNKTSPRQSTTRHRNQSPSGQRSPLNATDQALLDAVASIQLNRRTGEFKLYDQNGNDLGDEAIDAVKRHAPDALKGILSEHVTQYQRLIDRIDTVHHDTPAPDAFPIFVPARFELDAPQPPEPAPSDWLSFICPPRRRAIAEKNRRKQQRHREAMSHWSAIKKQHDDNERLREHLYESARSGDLRAMETVLDDHLMDIDWPQETGMSFEIRDNGQHIYIDVDLPDRGNFPCTTLRLYQRGIGVKVSPLSDTAIRKKYMGHVHGMGFRLIGEAFAAAPSAHTVTLAAFSQVPDSATGNINDHYLYSVKVDRDAWASLNFERIVFIDPTDALALFDLRRDMTKTGIFSHITVHD